MGNFSEGMKAFFGLNGGEPENKEQKKADSDMIVVTGQLGIPKKDAEKFSESFKRGYWPLPWQKKKPKKEEGRSPDSAEERDPAFVDEVLKRIEWFFSGTFSKNPDIKLVEKLVDKIDMEKYEREVMAEMAQAEKEAFGEKLQGMSTEGDTGWKEKNPAKPSETLFQRAAKQRLERGLEEKGVDAQFSYAPKEGEFTISFSAPPEDGKKNYESYTVTYDAVTGKEVKASGDDFSLKAELKKRLKKIGKEWRSIMIEEQINSQAENRDLEDLPRNKKNPFNYKKGFGEEHKQEKTLMDGRA